VKKNVEPQKQFDAQNKKELLKQAKQEFLKPDIAYTSIVHHAQDVPTYELPSSLDHTNESHPLGQVSAINDFLQSCVKLLNDPSSIKVLQNMLEICNKDVEGKLEQKTINHLHTRRRTSREFIMNANIG
jgi:hypothetical protein